jgi:hypothetical protein
MTNFITLFDKNYLSRGLALYQSLLKYADDFLLHILAVDDETEHYLLKKKYEKTNIILLRQIESAYPELNKIKLQRTRGEYCWTLTPYCLHFALKQYNLPACTYLDSDIYFFYNPSVIFEELDNNSVIITEHRYTPEYDQTTTSGKYCVQFMFFKNDEYGLKVLEWWRDRCAEWCYAKFEDGKFGDQKYLDDWTTRFQRICVPKHIGCGAAPWNIQQYDIINNENVLNLQDKITKLKMPLVFFHFHTLKKYISRKKMFWLLSNFYKIDNNAKEKIYKPYILKLLDIESKLDEYLLLNFRQGFISKIKGTFSYFYIKNIIKSFCIKSSFASYNNKPKSVLYNHEITR